MTQAVACKRVTWESDHSMAPQQSGVWEWFVQSCKRLFYRIFANRRLAYEILHTTFCLIEQFLSARPLTAASADPSVTDVIALNHFFLGGSNVSSAFHVPEKTRPVYHRQQWRKLIGYADAIWERWIRGIRVRSGTEKTQ